MGQDVVVLPGEGDGVRVIACSGDFDQPTLEPLRQACVPAVADPAVRRIVLDVSRVTFLDSSMLDVMLYLQRCGHLEELVPFGGGELPPNQGRPVHREPAGRGSGIGRDGVRGGRHAGTTPTGGRGAAAMRLAAASAARNLRGADSLWVGMHPAPGF